MNEINRRNSRRELGRDHLKPNQYAYPDKHEDERPPSPVRYVPIKLLHFDSIIVPSVIIDSFDLRGGNPLLNNRTFFIFPFYE